MSAREALATAANTVEGITAHPYVSNDTKPGTAFVRLDRIDYPNRFGGVAFWNVILILPQEQRTAEQYLEANLPALRDALGAEMTLTTVRRVRLDIPGAGILPTAFFDGHREAD